MTQGLITVTPVMAATATTGSAIRNPKQLNWEQFAAEDPPLKKLGSAISRKLSKEVGVVPANGKGTVERKISQPPSAVQALSSKSNDAEKSIAQSRRGSTQADRPLETAGYVREAARDKQKYTATSLKNTIPQKGLAREFLTQLVTKALAVSPNVREASANLQASRFDVDEAKGQRWPQVQVGANSPTATFGGKQVNDSARDAFGSVTVTTPVFDWGRISSTVDSRSETFNAAQEELTQVRQRVAFDTANALLEVDRNRRALKISNAYVKRLDEFVAMLGEIVQSDPGRGSELTQAKARRLQAIASRDLLETKMQEARVALAKQVGEDVSVPEELRWDTSSVALAEALSVAPEHPALRQARAEARAATKHVDSLHASRFPQVNWVISKTTQKDVLGNSQPWATGVALQWNAFQGGSANASERAALERAAASEQRAEIALRDLNYQLRSTAEQRDSATRRAVDYGSLKVETDRVRKAFFEQWFHLGRRTLLDVLTAENEHYNTEVAQVNGQYDAYAANLRMRTDAAILLEWLFGATKVPV